MAPVNMTHTSSVCYSAAVVSSNHMRLPSTPLNPPPPLTQLSMTRRLPPGMSSSTRDICEQLRRKWGGTEQQTALQLVDNSMPIEIRPAHNSMPIEIRPADNNVPIQLHSVDNSVPIDINPSENSVPMDIHPSDNSVPIDIHPANNSVPIDIHPANNSVPIDILAADNSVPIDILAADNSVSIDIHPAGNSVPIDIHTSGNSVPIEPADHSVSPVLSSLTAFAAELPQVQEDCGVVDGSEGFIETNQEDRGRRVFHDNKIYVCLRGFQFPNGRSWWELLTAIEAITNQPVLLPSTSPRWLTPAIKMLLFQFLLWDRCCLANLCPSEARAARRAKEWARFQKVARHVAGVVLRANRARPGRWQAQLTAAKRAIAAEANQVTIAAATHATENAVETLKCLSLEYDRVESFFMEFFRHNDVPCPVVPAATADVVPRLFQLTCRQAVELYSSAATAPSSEIFKQVQEEEQQTYEKVMSLRRQQRIRENRAAMHEGVWLCLHYANKAIKTQAEVYTGYLSSKLSIQTSQQNLIARLQSGVSPSKRRRLTCVSSLSSLHSPLPSMLADDVAAEQEHQEEKAADGGEKERGAENRAPVELNVTPGVGRGSSVVMAAVNHPYRSSLASMQHQTIYPFLPAASPSGLEQSPQVVSTTSPIIRPSRLTAMVAPAAATADCTLSTRSPPAPPAAPPLRRRLSALAQLMPSPVKQRARQSMRGGGAIGQGSRDSLARDMVGGGDRDCGLEEESGEWRRHFRKESQRTLASGLVTKHNNSRMMRRLGADGDATEREGRHSAGSSYYSVTSSFIAQQLNRFR
eukprot:GHVS01045415.1.p1 GENE.GHVS01045415.1~~GHVS01045415.1.p1  ORF type:complete len:900 (-),score=160.69 GHVS01045415.1:78-2501(-)